MMQRNENAKIRPPAVAGMFYPDDAAELTRTLEVLLQSNIPKNPVNAKDIKAIIAPHAGYIYSGPVAAAEYQFLNQRKDDIENIILIGPSHRVPLLGLATSSADYYTTPLGEIPVNREITKIFNELPFVGELDQAHSLEHSLEVHLPFFQHILKDFQLVPVVAGDATAEQVSQFVELALRQQNSLLVISSDLSHYHDYNTAKRLDNDTCNAIESLAVEQLDSKHACGYIPVRGLLKYAKEHGLTAETIDCRNSGDTTGPKDQVVGYGAYVFT